MKYRRIISFLLSIAIAFGCLIGFPTSAQQLSAEITDIPSLSSIAANVNGNEHTPNHTEPAKTDKTNTSKTKHIKRLHAEEALDSHVYLNNDGSRTLYLYEHPVQYLDKQGNRQDISLDIADTADAKYPFRTKANSSVTYFPASLSDGVKLSSNGVELRLAVQVPISSTNITKQVQRMDDQTISYTYDSNTTIEYSLTYTGFKEDIVVSSYTGQTEYNFFLYTNGLSLTELNGSYYLTDDAGNIQASVGDVIVFTADERNNTFGEMRAETIKPKQIYALTIVLDAEYLADPKTVYPIHIDPTISLTYAESGANAIDDVTLHSTSTSNGGRTFLLLGLRPSGGISRILMKFPGIDFSAYAGVTITSATVSLRDLMCESSELGLSCYPFTGSNWDESTASWDTVTQSWGELLDRHVISYSNGTAIGWRYSFEIKEAVQRWVNGDTTIIPEKGIIFKADDTIENSTTLDSRTFGSFERDSYKPVFTMTYKITDALNFDTILVDEGESFTLSLQNSSPSDLTWESGAPNIATVDSSGKVTALKAGFTIISANSDDFTIPPICIVNVKIKDGVYQLRNEESEMYLDVTGGGVTSGTEVQQYMLATTPYIRNQLFKITYLSADTYTVYYSIRSMTNSGLGLYAKMTHDNEIVTIESMSTDDDFLSIPWEQTWQIDSWGSGYNIYSSNDEYSRYLTATSADEIGGQVIVGRLLNYNYSSWNLIPYTGEELEGLGMLNSIPDVIMCGNNFDFYNAFMYSTKIGCNGPVKYSVGEVGNSSTTIASIDPNTGFLRPKSFGSEWVLFTFDGSDKLWGYSVDIIPAGCREYVDVMTGTDYARTMNCQGYAFGTFNTPRSWQKDENGNPHEVFNWVLKDTTDIDSNDILYGTDAFTGLKEILETYYLDVVFENRWKEVYTNNDGWDVELEDNQFIVVFRVGKHGTDFDYHFWYRTDEGRWANKHGTTKGSEYLHDMPSNDQSDGWKSDGTAGFYDSDIIYYVITQEG